MGDEAHMLIIGLGVNTVSNSISTKLIVGTMGVERGEDDLEAKELSNTPVSWVGGDLCERLLSASAHEINCL